VNAKRDAIALKGTRVKAPRVDGQVTALAGEFFVAAELLKRGLQTSVTFGNAKAIDLLAYNPKTKRTFTVQVKALRPPARGACEGAPGRDSGAPWRRFLELKGDRLEFGEGLATTLVAPFNVHIRATTCVRLNAGHKREWPSTAMGIT
jgi:hypothetical protein